MTVKIDSYNWDDYPQILAEEENYCMPSLNEVKIISDRQTLSLVLGSCISTVIVGRNSGYYLGANHIVIAKPSDYSRIATKSALDQIDEILWIFKRVLRIKEEHIICLHMVGAGAKINIDTFTVHEKNIEEATNILSDKKLDIVFNDTGHYYLSTYSIYKNNLSVFIENKHDMLHKSFIMDLDLLFQLDIKKCRCFPGSGLGMNSKGFEFLVNKKIITFITGQKINKKDFENLS